MDPLSITSGVVGIGAVCWRIINYLKDIPAAVAGVQKEIDRLIAEVESLYTIVQSIDEAFEGSFTKSSGKSPLGESNLENMWRDCKRSLEACRTTATDLECIVKEIYGKTGVKVTSKFDGLGKENRRLDKAANLQRVREKLRSEKANLQILLTGIGLQLVTLHLSFWGIFWIDASSHERIRQTYADIGRLGKVEPNHSAAMHWLSNSELSWLLIMDNANDPHIDLHEYFPKGNRGYIIITTLNPAHKVYGNLTPGYFEFEGMEDDDACALLLRTARRPEPWDAESLSLAVNITRKLGFLALAIIHAGAVIRNGLCTLKDYLTFYDSNWEHIRRTRQSFVDSGHRWSDYMSTHATFEVSYNSIEKKGTEPSRDAIQLLKLFSFFHFNNIRFDILKKAVINCEIERVGQEKNEKHETERPLTWYQKYKSMQSSILNYIMQDRSPPALPSFIREGRASRSFDELRMRYALKELVQMSLIMHNKSIDSYSMHPLVHKWARERPDMSTSEQAVWSQAAATTLSHSILFPHLGETEVDELFRRDILPHIDHVRKCLQLINDRISEKRKDRWYGLVEWPGAGSRFGRTQALLYAKFSIVFAHNGRWNEAESLQLAVKQYADSVLGREHPITRRITLVLALTYWSQGRSDEAAELQDAVLQACIASLGPNSHETLMAMDQLGLARWQQGRYSDARILQQRAVDGLLRVKGPNHEDTFSAMGNLGRTLAKFYENLDEVKQLLNKAHDGMSKILGPSHLKSLAVKEDIAMVTLQMEEQLPLAATMVEEVLESRKEKLGKEHPYTLLSMVNLARVKIALGQYQEAESLVLSGLQVADRNLGLDHIGTLMGRTVLGVIQTRQSRFSEAEATFLEVIEKLRHVSSYRGDFHPDRLGAMIELATCYKLQGKVDQGIKLCDETIEGLNKISLKEHPLERKTKKMKSDLIEMKNGNRK
ncbi:hypothetical protein MaudMau93_000311 [Microsporum audouinii]